MGLARWQDRLGGAVPTQDLSDRVRQSHVIPPGLESFAVGLHEARQRVKQSPHHLILSVSILESFSGLPDDRVADFFTKNRQNDNRKQQKGSSPNLSSSSSTLVISSQLHGSKGISSLDSTSPNYLQELPVSASVGWLAHSLQGSLILLLKAQTDPLPPGIQTSNLVSIFNKPVKHLICVCNCCLLQGHSTNVTHTRYPY
ncbi:hypothetical protein ILYODFUR_029052 [Ilyodon furcidens]|uniref:Uncharacterized protein n=1 Tax=Ilyodon furcidens TaxID=33524 RepID=A0ABV0TCA8_9TELE